MKDRITLHPDETLDALSCGSLSIFQKKKGYRYSLDAYLLGAFVEEAAGTEMIEIGSGSGVVSILLAAMKGLHMLGIEIQPDLAEMSGRSVERAGLQGTVRIVCKDVRDYSGPAVDAIVTNPPYRPLDTGRINPDNQKAVARHEISLDLSALLKKSHELLKPGGRFYIVYPSWRLPDLFCTMRSCRIEPKGMRCAYTSFDRTSEICLVCGIRDGGRELTIESPLLIFSGKGAYHDDMESVFRDLRFLKKPLT